MMRVKLSAGILLILVTVGVFSELYTARGCRRIESDISAIETSLTGGGDAADSARQLGYDWDGFLRVSVMLLRSDRIMEIDRTVARIVRQSENGDTEELPAELSELRSMVELVRESELPHITSIL